MEIPVILLSLHLSFFLFPHYTRHVPDIKLPGSPLYLAIYYFTVGLVISLLSHNLTMSFVTTKKKKKKFSFFDIVY